MAGHLASLDADHALYTFAVYYKFENGLLAIGKIYTADSPALSSISAYHHNRIFSPWMNYFLCTRIHVGHNIGSSYEHHDAAAQTCS